MYLTLFLPAEYYVTVEKCIDDAIELISSRWLHNEAGVVYYTEYIRQCIKKCHSLIFFNIYSLNVIICMTMEKMSALRVTIRNNAST